jgi:hypothetical protein
LKSINRRKARLGFSFAEVGIQARGRTTILRMNYRSCQFACRHDGGSRLGLKGWVNCPRRAGVVMAWHRRIPFIQNLG